MTPNQQMEQFSLAYIRAVAAQAGYQVTRPETDTGIDGTLMDDAGRRSRIDFQAKSTADDIQRDSACTFLYQYETTTSCEMQLPALCAF
jgi:hypothetical protein